MLDRLKSLNKTVGLKQTLKAVENDTAEVVFIAKDADEKVIRNIIELADKKSLQVVYVDSMKTLGKACGIEVGSAVACIIKGNK